MSNRNCEGPYLKISVIIPVYNIESYVEACVQSVCAQDYTNMEIILVDDGSTDRSGAICDQLVTTDNRIHVIHKINGGLSDARNAGIAAAIGDYVLFLDGDDVWGSSHAVSTLAERIACTKADVLNFSYVKWFEDTDKKKPYFQDVPAMPTLGTVAEQLDYLTKNGLYIASACNKLIRRTLLLDLPFECGTFSEDIAWCAKLMLCADSMDFICENFYLYRQRSSSIRHTINDKKCMDLTRNILSCINLCNEASAERQEALSRYTAFQFGTFFAVQAQAENPQPECVRFLKEHHSILRYHCARRKLQILNIGCRMLPFSWLCKLIRFVYHKKWGRHYGATDSIYTSL